MKETTKMDLIWWGSIIATVCILQALFVWSVSPADAMTIGPVPPEVAHQACDQAEGTFDNQVFGRSTRAHVVVGDFDFTINDGPGVGLNDPVLGDARMACVNAAAERLSAFLVTNVPIEVLIDFPSMFANESSAVLGSTGTSGWARNFAGAPIANTWYPGALADTLAGSDLVPSQFDMNVSMNRNIDDPATLGGRVWYYGTDANPQDGDIDCLAVMLHEIGHGLGITTRMARCGDVNNPICAAFFDGSPSATMRNMSDQFGGPWVNLTREGRIVSGTGNTRMHQVGPRVRAESVRFSEGVTDDHVHYYSPPNVSSGSSWAHPSNAMFPNDVMEPFYTGPEHDLGLIMAILEDQGWPTTRVTPTSSTTTTTLSPPICSSQCDLNGDGDESVTDSLISLQVAVQARECPSLCE